MVHLAAIVPAPKATLEVKEIETPNPGVDGLLIKNEVIAFNPIEAKIAKVGAIPLDYPAILGSTFAGTIEAKGPEVEDLSVGDRVVVSKKFGVKDNQSGAFQHYVVVKDKMVSKIPEGIDPAIPASLMMNLTCVVGLFTGRLGLDKPTLDGIKATQKDEKILIYGGSSSFGGLSVEYLSQAGYQVITTSSPRNRNFVSKLGASAVIDHTLELDLLRDALIAQGPYEAVVDMISLPETVAVTAKVLESQGGGTLYTMQPAFGSETLPDGVNRVFEPWSDSLYETENQRLQEWVVGTYLPQGLLQRAITPIPIEKVIGGLKGIDAALERIQKGVSGLKLVADPWEVTYR